MFQRHVTFVPIAAAALLAGCAATTPAPVPGSEAAPVALRWHAPLPHEGRLADLSRWWAQFDDPLMLRLIDEAQRVSPTLAEAATRIADARAARVAGSAALLPTVDATASASRGRSEPGSAVGNTSSTGVQLSWELDLFGAGRAGAQAAQARLQASEAGWHHARVSVAAEAATTYLELRTCEAQVEQATLDATSRAQTSRITRLSAAAGLQAPAAADLANASAAEGDVKLIQQRAQCDVWVKSLIALTAQDEPALRSALQPGTARLPRPHEFAITSVPAKVLAQRPDLHAASHEVSAASADAAQAQALRWPRITLSGNIAHTRLGSSGFSTDGTVWSVGPVSVTLPLFDAGVRRANAQAARVRYDTATLVYLGRLREAVRDVEVALVALDSTRQRNEGALGAVTGYERSYRATEASYRAGTANLFELEDARRSLVNAQVAVIDLQRERVSAWVGLYRALGGGWSLPPSSALPDNS